MSAVFRQKTNVEPKDAEENDSKAQLEFKATPVSEMVEQMKHTSMEFEEDVDDPFEKALVAWGNQKKQRPNSAQQYRGSRRGRGRFNTFNAGRGYRSSQNGDESYEGVGNRKSVYNSPRSLSYDKSSSQGWSSPARGQYSNFGRHGSGRRGNQHYSPPYDHGYAAALDNEYSDKLENPHQLVGVLCEYPDFRASLLQLMEVKNMSPSAIRQIVSSHRNIFELQGETVMLHPKFGFCKDHSGSLGCQNQSSCSDLHLCPKYVMSWCNDKNCVLGHRWYTDHNNRILQAHYLKGVLVQNLRKLVQTVVASAHHPAGTLDICKEYNRNGCNKHNCGALHICQSFIKGRTKCSNSGCQLNHDVLSTECCYLLMSNGISTNEAPRDIVLAILSANSSLSSSQVQVSDGNSVNQQQAKSPSKNITQNDSSTINDDRTGAARSSRNKGKEVKTSVKDKQKQGDTTSSKSLSGTTRKQLKTVWSHEYYGDTIISEICYYSVEAMCRNEESGCQRLHCTNHFHWQVSEQGINWLNLSSQQLTALEYAYCDCSQDEIMLPRLDPSALESSLKSLFTLMGRDKWTANFQAMIVSNSNFSKVVYLRRLCTQEIAGKDIKAGRYQWYFLDKNKKWVQYGNVDTAGERNLVSSATSDDIEKHYIQNPGVPLSFQNSNYTYILDFNTMTQTNQQTNVSREVRRRPAQHLKRDRGKTHSSASDGSSEIPSTWEPMQPQERFRLVILTSGSSEYQNVMSLVGANVVNIVKIERIQNPFLLKAFQNKVKEMTTVYGSYKKVDVRQLFHGTSAKVIANICAENFDWRLHGTSSGQSYGRGTYFSPNVNTSLGYCRPDSSGLRYLFIANVAVGSITAGGSSTVRPPINSSTGTPYDSTGDGVNVIVKYDKQEYYPQYIITMR